MAAGDHGAGLGRHRCPALEHTRHHLEREGIARPAHEVQAESRPPTHGVHIGQGVGRCHPSPVVGVVDDGREEVDGGHQREVGRDAVHGGVVGRLQADQQRRVRRPYGM